MSALGRQGVVLALFWTPAALFRASAHPSRFKAKEAKNKAGYIHLATNSGFLAFGAEQHITHACLVYFVWLPFVLQCIQCLLYYSLIADSII
jgi:hypothetical protein